MKLIPTISFLLVFFFFFGNYSFAAEVLFGPHEKLIMIYDLPSNGKYISSDNRPYDLGLKYETFDFFASPIFIVDEGKIVGYINSTDYELLTNDGINQILTENNLKDIQTLYSIPFWDKWGGKMVVCGIIIILILFFLKRKRNKYLKDNELEI